MTISELLPNWLNAETVHTRTWESESISRGNKVLTAISEFSLKLPKVFAALQRT